MRRRKLIVVDAVRHRERPIFGVQGHPEHCRATFEADEREYRRRDRASIGDRDLERVEAPRILENFARMVEAGQPG